VLPTTKTENLHPAGLLQPLQLLSQVWSDISIDFIEGLPKVNGKFVLFVVVDRFFEFGHFIPLSHPYIAIIVAQAFFSTVFWLHGVPESVVSDRDVILLAIFGRNYFGCGTKLSFSSAYYPQSDGQTMVVNHTIEMYPRCFVGDKPKDWVQWLLWVLL
ncbi:hypothetical protein MANES_01G005504v8, partial [Manihot esculenta]